MSAARGSGPIGSLRAAFGLLTRLPAGDVESPSTGAASFPLVGAALGAVAAVPVVVLAARDAPIAAILAIAILAILDGGLHLDGLADSIDALAAPDRVAAERARTDPRVGPAGAAAVVLVVAADIASIALLGATDRSLAAPSIVGAAAGARAAVAIAAPWLSRRDDGFGAWFAAGTSRLAALAAAIGLGAIVALVCLVGRTLVPGVSGAIAAAVAAATVVGLARAQHGATGDAHGAAIELGFAAGLIVAAVLRP